MAGTPFKCGSIISFCVVFYAIYYRGKESDDRLSPVRDNLLNLESANKVALGDKQPRVALGYGACHDLFVRATALLNHTEMKGEPRHFDEISTKDELLRSFAYFFKHGAAAERFMSDNELYDSLVEEALKLPDRRWALGGNAPLMAKRFYLEGWNVLLGGKMSKKLRSYIPEEIKIVGDNEGQDIRDDIHMILEYRADEKWGPYIAPRANRYILHNDDNNPLITSLEAFGEYLPSFRPHLVVISGLQMMDNYPFMKGNVQGLREDRIKLVREQIYSQPKTSLVHFEMASYVELQLLQHLTEYVIPNVDSIGMNEQEIENLYHVLQYGNVSIVADSNPRVATSLDHMRKIFNLIRKKNEQNANGRELTRIHVHTLAYQAILTVTSSQWKRTKAAVAKASLTAHRYVCNTDNISIDKSKLLLDESFSTTTHSDTNRVYFEPSEPVSCWQEVLKQELVDICVAPVLICTEAQLTAGAGDNISAAGLVLQVE